MSRVPRRLALCSPVLFGVVPLAAQGSAAAQVGALNARFMRYDRALSG